MRTRDLGILAGLAALLALTRWPLAPQYLFYFDSVNMAYALDEFDPRKHFPQPPGYPLYVALCRGIRALGLSVEDTMLASGVVAGALAGWLLWRFCEDLGNARAGWMSALIFSFNPVFWFNSITNQSRGFSAVASAGTAWFCWRAGKPDAHPGWLAGAACFLGTLAGFRPVESLMLAPLLLWAVWKGRPRLKHVAWAVAAGGMPVLIWGSWLLAASGGLDSYVELIRNYSQAEKVFATGTAANPWKVFFKSVEYVGAIHLVCFLPWAWALVLARPQLRGMGLFVTVWLVPGLAFQILGHAADPCHLLATVAGLCWIGGMTLSRLPHWKGKVATGVAVVVGTALFLHPLRGAARATSYDVVRRVNTAVVEAIDTCHKAAEASPLTIVLRDSLVTWRHLRYYFPQATIWVDVGNRWSPSGAETPPEQATGPIVLVDRQGSRVVPTLPEVSH
jgi:4-amino-4-deoxy-L-arabinose transferase-like glycosyltransferase